MAFLPIAILLLAGVGTSTNGLLQADIYSHKAKSTPAAPAILSMAGSIITMAQKTKPGAYSDVHLALATVKVIVDVINIVFDHEDGGSAEINQDIADAYFDASVSCKHMVRKLYSAAVIAEMETSALLAVQESLKGRPHHAPTLKQLQIIISSGLTLPTSIEKDLEDVLAAYVRVIKLCQTDAIAKERREVLNKMSGAIAVGLVSGAAGLYYAVVDEVYNVAMGAAVVSVASFSKAVELRRSFSILEDRLKFLKKTKDEAGRQYSSVSDIQLLVQMLQSRIDGITETTALDLRLQDGIRKFLSSDMTRRLRMHSLDLLTLQEDCLQLSYSMNKASRV